MYSPWDNLNMCLLRSIIFSVPFWNTYRYNRFLPSMHLFINNNTKNNDSCILKKTEWNAHSFHSREATCRCHQYDASRVRRTKRHRDLWNTLEKCSILLRKFHLDWKTRNIPFPVRRPIWPGCKRRAVPRVPCSYRLGSIMWWAPNIPFDRILLPPVETSYYFNFNECFFL